MTFGLLGFHLFARDGCGQYFRYILQACGHRFLVGTGGSVAGLIGRGGADMATTLR